MKQIIIVGGIGNTDRQNRDGCRVLGGGGVTTSIKAHISGDKILVVRKYERVNTIGQNGSHNRQLI